MIRVIFSYIKSAAVFCCMLALIAAGVTATVLFTKQTADLVVRLIGFAVFAVAAYAVIYLYTLKLIGSQITVLGERECKFAELGARLQVLSRRAAFKSVKGIILLSYADSLIWQGEYQKAMTPVSDAVAANKPYIKEEAAIRFCKIFFMQKDAEYFNFYFDKAVNALNKKTVGKKPDMVLSPYAAVEICILQAFKLYLDGDASGAAAKIAASTPATERQTRSLMLLAEYFNKGNAQQP